LRTVSVMSPLLGKEKGSAAGGGRFLHSGAKLSPGRRGRFAFQDRKSLYRNWGFSPIAFAKPSERTGGAFAQPNGIVPWPTANNTAPSCSSSTGTSSDPFRRPTSPGLNANLAPDFFNTNSDGSFIDRKAFLAQIARGSSFKNIREHEVLIRTLGDFGIIHARFSYQKPDGSEGAGRYTDDWQRRPLAMRFGPTDGALIGATKPFDAASNATQS
jgi:uncharacterized protein DUF4440